MKYVSKLIVVHTCMNVKKVQFHLYMFSTYTFDLVYVYARHV